MIASPRIEIATAEDVMALAALREEQGWLRNELLLSTIQAWECGRIFILREGALLADSPDPRAIIAATSALAAVPLGVIGNVITHVSYRRRGLGRLLMDAALDWLRERGVRSVVLDATPDGRPLYMRLGFRPGALSWDAYGALPELHRDWLREHAGTLRAVHAPASALADLAALDAMAYGGDRLDFLALLLRHPSCWLYTVADGASGLVGYAVTRVLEGAFKGVRVGPLAATSEAAAAALLTAALADDAPWHQALPRTEPAVTPHLYVSMPGNDDRIRAFYTRLGTHLHVDDLVMQLDFASGGDESAPDGPPARPVAAHPEWLYAWTSPMVF